MEFKDNVDEEKENFYIIDRSLFKISLAVVITKLLILYWSTFPSYTNFLTWCFQVIYFLPLEILTSIWMSSGWLIQPVAVGIAMSLLTWQIVYLDSELPGVVPPTPFSYNKFYGGYQSIRKPNKYQLSYLFAIAVGPLITFSLIINNCFSHYYQTL